MIYGFPNIFTLLNKCEPYDKSRFDMVDHADIVTFGGFAVANYQS